MIHRFPIIYRTGDTDRFWSMVEKTEACWLWTGPQTPNGYGSFRSGSRRQVAHRTAWALSGRELIPSLTLDHLCRVRLCVNPDHLEQVSMRENWLRGLNHVAIGTRRETCKNGHPRTEANTRHYPSDRGSVTRHCIPCQNERNARRPRKGALAESSERPEPSRD